MTTKQQIIKIVSAIQFPEELKSTLESKLVAKIGNYPFEYSVDSSLIAGLKIQFNDTQYKYDLASEINHIQAELLG
jgi:F0F1-type ATP synthase delta subunit